MVLARVRSRRRGLQLSLSAQAPSAVAQRGPDRRRSPAAPRGGWARRPRPDPSPRRPTVGHRATASHRVWTGDGARLVHTWLDRNPQTTGPARTWARALHHSGPWGPSPTAGVSQTARLCSPGSWGGAGRLLAIPLGWPPEGGVGLSGAGPAGGGGRPGDGVAGGTWKRVRWEFQQLLQGHVEAVSPGAPPVLPQISASGHERFTRTGQARDAWRPGCSDGHQAGLGARRSSAAPAGRDADCPVSGRPDSHAAGLASIAESGPRAPDPAV